MHKIVPNLPKALIPIYGITLMDIVGYTIMIPLLPSIAQRYGAPDFLVGVLMTTTAVCSTVTAPMWGWLSDRFGRKRIVMTSQVFSLAGYFLIAVAPDFAMVFVSRAIAGSGGGNLGVAESYIADVTEPKHRDTAFALYAGLFGLGFILGPVIGGFLVHVDFGAPFYLAAFLELLNIGFTYKFLPRLTPDTKRRAPQSPAHILGVLRMPRIGNLLLRQLFFIFATTYFLTTFSLFIKHVLDYGPDVTGWLLATAGVVGGLTFIALNPLVARFGNSLVSEIGFALSLIAYLGVGFVPNLGAFVATVVVWAAGAALAQPALTTLLSEAAPEGERGAVLGLGDSANNLALMAGPALGAFVIGLHPRASGIVPALASALAIGLGLRAKGTRTALSTFGGANAGGEARES